MPRSPRSLRRPSSPRSTATASVWPCTTPTRSTASRSTRAIPRPSTWRPCAATGRAPSTADRSVRCATVPPKGTAPMVDAPRLLSARTNPLLKDLRRLVDDPGAYRRVGRVWLEGDHLLRALMARGGAVQEVLLTPAAWGRTDLQALALRSGARLSLVEPALMSEISSLETPASMGAVMAWPGAQSGETGALDSVVLDRLQDAGNVGTILRSAAALGARQVIALKGTAALWSPKVLRAGMGAHFSLRLFEAVDAERLARLGVPLLATSSHGGHLLHEAPL